MIKFLTVLIASISLVVVPFSNVYALPAGTAAASAPNFSRVTIGGSPAANAPVYLEFVPAAGAGGAAAVSAPALAGLAAALAVGTAAGYVGVGYICSNNLSGLCPTIDPEVRLPFSNKPINQVAPPSAPSLVPVSPSNQPSDLGTTAQNCYAVGSLNNPNGPNPSCGSPGTLASCLTFAAAGGGNYCGVTSPSNGGNVALFNNASASAMNYGVGGVPKFNAAPNCQSGYTLTSGNCFLTNPREVTPDNKIDYKQDAAGFTLIKDIDGLSPANTPVVSGRSAQFNGIITDSAGSPHEVWISNTSSTTGDDNQVQIAYNPNKYPDNSPSNIENLTINTHDGQIASTSLTQTAGQVAPQGSTYRDAAGTTKTVLPGQIIIVTPNAPGATAPPVQIVSSPVQAPAPKLDLPTDYARQGEAGTSADKIVDKLAETTETPDMQLPTIPDNPLTAALQPWRSWIPPSSIGSCPSGSFVVFEHEYNFDAACTILEAKASVISSAMTAFYGVLAVFILLGA